MLLEQMLPAPIGGVSQVPPELRGHGQLSEAINTFPSTVRGLGSRKGTEVIASSVQITGPSTGQTIEWSPGTGERYIVHLSTAGVVVMDVKTGVLYKPYLGADYFVSNGNVTDFFGPLFFGSIAEPRQFTTAVMGDKIYVASKGFSKVKWGDDQSQSPRSANRALIEIVDAPEGVIYTIVLDGVSYSIAPPETTGEGFFVQSGNAWAARYVTQQMKASGATAMYTFKLMQNYVDITRIDGEALDIHVGDTIGGEGIKLTTGSVQALEDLPKVATPGWILRVSGLGRTTADDYWVRYVQDALDYSSGEWVESAAPGSNVSLDNVYMPWVLKATTAGGGRSFTFGPTYWSPRAAGDDESNPRPAIDSIDLLFSAEQRLGMTSGANISLSAAGKAQQVFRKTVSQLLPDDPINVRSALGPESAYHHAVEWDNAVFLWNDRAQVRLSGEPVLTPTTIALSIESRFENCPTVAPIVIGSRVYYVQEVNGCTRVYEYWRPPGYNMPPTVTDVTADVPTYLFGKPKGLTGDEALGFLCVHTETPGDHIYVCHFNRDGNGGIQPRWHTWVFAETNIHAAMMVGGLLHFILSRMLGGTSTVQLESLDVANPAETSVAIPRDASGYLSFEVRANLEGFYFRDERGNNITARVTLTDLDVHHTDSRVFGLQVVGERQLRLKQNNGVAVSGTYRIPMMLSNLDLKLKLIWKGFLTGMVMKAHSRSRGRRL